MASENSEIQKRFSFNGLAASGGLSKSSVIRLNSAAAQPIALQLPSTTNWSGGNGENGGNLEHH
jgi:hypothetical protein